MTSKRLNNSSTSGALAYRVLDTRTLGRPTHLLPRFTMQLREDLAEELRAGLNRRYRAGFQVRGIRMSPMGEAVMPGRWTNYLSDAGRIDCAIDRDLVLCALAYRYGSNPAHTAAATSPETMAETETEKRLCSMLSLQFVNTLVMRMTSDPAGTLPGSAKRHEFSAVAPGTPPRGAWLIEVEIEEPTHGVAGKLCFTLCEAWMERLWRTLSPLRERSAESRRSGASLAAQLKFRLTAQLLEIDLPLGNLLDLHVGDVIPVRLDAADVMIDRSRLFTATVAEHKGKLCLTSFEDAD